MRILTAIVAASALSAFGFTDNKWQADPGGNWNGKWSDTAHWSKGRVPNGSADDNAIFDNQSVPYTVEVDGDYVVPGFFKIGDNVARPGTGAITFVGNGSIRQTPASLYVYTGREVCYAGNVTIGATVSCAMEIMAGSKVQVRGGASVLVDGSLSIGDGVEVRVSEQAHVKGTPIPANSCTSGVLSLSGGQWRCNGSIPAFPADMRIEISGGRMIIASSCRDVRFLPKGVSTKVDLVGSSTESFKATSAFAEELSGTFANTNAAGDAGFRFDAPAEIYGGGKIITDWYLPQDAASGTPSVLDVSHLSIGTYQYAAGNCMVEHPSDMTISGHGNYTRPYGANGNYFDGEVTFDTLDTFDRATVRNVLFSGVRMKPGCGFKVVGGGTQTLHVNEECRDPALRGIEVDAATTLKFAEDSIDKAVRPDTLRLGAGATLAYKASRTPISAAEAEIAADAKVEVNLKDFTATQETLARPFFMTSSGSIPSLSQFDISNNTGWEIKSVGGVIYGKSTTAEEKPNPSPWRWTGAVSDDWSNGHNWAYNASYGPGGGADAYFTLVDNGRNEITIPAGGAQINRIVGGGVYQDDTHAADWYRNAEPFVFKGGKLTIYGTGSGDYNSSIYTCSKSPLIFECPVNADTLGVLGYSYIALKGGLTATDLRLVGEVRIGGAATVQKVTAAADIYTTDCQYTTLTVLKGGSFKTTQTSNNGVHLGIRVLGGGEATFAETFAYSSTSIPTSYQVDGRLNFTGTLNLNAPVTISGTGRVDVAANASYSGDGRVTLKGGVTLSPKSWYTVRHTASDNGKMPISVMAAQKATLAPRGDITYGPASGNTPTTTPAERALVLGRRATLTVATDDIDDPTVARDVLVTDPVDAREMAQIVKTGAGKLTLASADNSFLDKAGVDVRAGTFAWTAAQTFGTLKASSGAKLAFSASDGVLPALTVKSDVNLDGVELVASDAAALDLISRRYQTLVNVPEGRAITGTPVLKDLKVRIVPTGDGQSLQIRQQTGLSIVVR